MLFFGHLRTSLNANEFTTVLASTGILGALHIFSWLVVFQYRKNLMDEQRLLARIVASAPPPPEGMNVTRLDPGFRFWNCDCFFCLQKNHHRGLKDRRPRHRLTKRSQRTIPEVKSPRHVTSKLAFPVLAQSLRPNIREPSPCRPLSINNLSSKIKFKLT